MKSCQGLCSREGIKNHRMIYLTHDSCRPCNVFYPKNKYKRCPCCSANLSILPKSPKLKERYRQIYAMAVSK